MLRLWLLMGVSLKYYITVFKRKLWFQQYVFVGSLGKEEVTQYTQNICITFIERRPNVSNVGPTLYKCYTNELCLLGSPFPFFGCGLNVKFGVYCGEVVQGRRPATITNN